MPSELSTPTNLLTRDLGNDDLDSLLALYRHLHADDAPGAKRQHIHDFYVSLGFDKASKQAFITRPPA